MIEVCLKNNILGLVTPSAFTCTMGMSRQITEFKNNVYPKLSKTFLNMKASEESVKDKFYECESYSNFSVDTITEDEQGIHVTYIYHDRGF